jgi:hypothetical protein
VGVDQLALFPSNQYAFELGLQVALCLGVGLLAGKRAVEMVHGAEVVAILARDDGELVVRMAGVGV